MLVTSSPQSTAFLNRLVSSDPVCLEEFGLFEMGEFKTTTHDSCPALRLSSQALCPIMKGAAVIVDGKLMVDNTVTCDDARDPQVWQLTRMDAPVQMSTVMDFGTGVPPFFFSQEQSGRSTVLYFFAGYEKAMTQGNWTFVDSLVTDTFSISAFGQTWSRGPNLPAHGAMLGYSQYMDQNYKVLSVNNLIVDLANAFGAAATFTENVKSPITNKIGTNLKNLAVFTFVGGLISKLEIYPDIPAYMAVSCAGYVQCTSGEWQTGGPTTIYQAPLITLINNSVTNNVYTSIQGLDPLTALDASSASQPLVGLLAFTFIVNLVLLGAVIFLARMVSRLRRSQVGDMEMGRR